MYHHLPKKLEIMGLLSGWCCLAAAAILILTTTTAALTPDGMVLLEIKSGFSNTKQQQVLGNWRATDDNPCNWTGITCHSPHLTVRSINLPYMQLGGTISPSIGKLLKLQRLALHQNSLHGSIPSELSNCTELRALYLRGNYLQGNIPPEIGHLTNLIILDLSSNSLKGSIPPSIARLAHLRFLNLSSNFLSGEIPYFGVLSSFKNTSFMGNLDLCGHPTLKLCRASLGFPAVLPQSDEGNPGVSPSPTRRPTHNFGTILIGAISIMGLGLVFLLCFLWICLLSRKGKHGEKYIKVSKQHVQDIGIKLVTFHGDLPYSSCDIIKKLEQLGEEDEIGSGGFGTVYKMVMDDFNAFAVKRIDRSCELSDKVFEKELKTLGSIKHINIVNLRGYCRLPSAKFLIYDYLALGSLDKYLHENGQEDQPLNWNARVRIALGSARGLAYLHHDCCPQIVHRNIKSSNILLDRSLEPRVSDFGLSKLLLYDDTHITTVVAGTFGYLAPEYLNNGKATEKSDVYSFGVLLLELVTGKRPTDMTFVEKGLNIVGWMNTVAGENRLDEIVHERCGYVDPEAVEAVLDIAAMCTEPNADNRPSMNRVLQMLEEETMSPCSSDFYASHLEI